MVIETKMHYTCGKFETWWVHVNGKKVLGPFASEFLAQLKADACNKRWGKAA